jgi:pyridoxine/pyridoxamine 5'-phosphate oxidase
MSACDLAVVGYISPAGTPRSAVVGIAITSDLEIVFDTVNSSRKFSDLKARPACSVTMWTGEVTVQLEGIAEQTTDDRYKEVYFRKMPDGRNRLSWPGIAYFVVRPNWIRYSNFEAHVVEELSF